MATKKRKPVPILYRRWSWMLDATRNINCYDYPKYGALGIKVYWSNYQDFESYILTNLGPPCAEKRFLHRIDQTLGFEPGNLEWADGRRMSYVKPRTRTAKYKNKKQNIKAWSEELVIPYGQVLDRVKKGWSISKIVKDWKERHELSL